MASLLPLPCQFCSTHVALHIFSGLVELYFAPFHCVYHLRLKGCNPLWVSLHPILTDCMENPIGSSWFCIDVSCSSAWLWPSLAWAFVGVVAYKIWSILCASSRILLVFLIFTTMLCRGLELISAYFDIGTFWGQMSWGDNSAHVEDLCAPPSFLH